MNQKDVTMDKFAGELKLAPEKLEMLKDYLNSKP